MDKSTYSRCQDCCSSDATTASRLKRNERNFFKIYIHDMYMTRDLCKCIVEPGVQVVKENIIRRIICRCVQNIKNCMPNFGFFLKNANTHRFCSPYTRSRLYFGVTYLVQYQCQERVRANQTSGQRSPRSPAVRSCLQPATVRTLNSPQRTLPVNHSHHPSLL